MPSAAKYYANLKQNRLKLIYRTYLKSPEATEELIESLVETDEKTGETSIKIPIANKQTGRNLFELVGKMFGS